MKESIPPSNDERGNTSAGVKCNSILPLAKTKTFRAKKGTFPVVYCLSLPFSYLPLKIRLYPKKPCPHCGETSHIYNWNQMRLINPDGSTTPMLFAYSWCGLGKILLKVRSYRRKPRADSTVQI